MVIRVSDKKKNYSKVTKLLVKPIKIGFKVNEPNGPNEPDIIQLIKMNPKITQIELANQLNLSRSTIKRMLNRLQQQEIVIRKTI